MKMKMKMKKTKAGNVGRDHTAPAGHASHLGDGQGRIGDEVEDQTGHHDVVGQE